MIYVIIIINNVYDWLEYSIDLKKIVALYLGLTNSTYENNDNWTCHNNWA